MYETLTVNSMVDGASIMVVKIASIIRGITPLVSSLSISEPYVITIIY